jgi:nucleoside-diphosphate-sugar epimerase
MTGATGLIGSRVADALRASGEIVTTIGRSEVDALEPGALAAHVAALAPDVLLHLAWTAGGTVGYRDSDENACWRAISREVAMQCLGNGTRFIGTGTVLDDPGLPADSLDAYARAKRELREDLSEALATDQATWIRPFYVFDPSTGRPELLRAARAAAMAGRAVELTTPDAVHDFVHLSDVVEAILRTISMGLTGVVDIGSGTVHTVADLVSRAGYRWTRADSVEHQRLHEDLVADTRKLSAAGWSPDETRRFFGYG